METDNVRRVKVFLVATFLLGVVGCSSIPKEAVNLNEELEKMIREKHRAHVALVNEFFAIRRKNVDLWIKETYAPKFLRSLRKEFGSAGVKLDSAVSIEALQKILSERDDLQADLEQERVKLLELISDDQVQTLQVIQRVTDLLRSAAGSSAMTVPSSQSKKVSNPDAVDPDE